MTLDHALISVGMTVLMLFLYGKPYERGFFCNDESLAHPFHESTVTSPMLYVIGLLLPICTVSQQVSSGFCIHVLPTSTWECERFYTFFTCAPTPTRPITAASGARQLCFLYKGYISVFDSAAMRSVFMRHPELCFLKIFPRYF